MKRNLKNYKILFKRFFLINKFNEIKIRKFLLKKIFFSNFKKFNFN